MASNEQVDQLRLWIEDQPNLGGLVVKSARLSLDERADGEWVTRVLLLLENPSGETWDLAQVKDLRRTLRQKGSELDLPTVSVSLVPESERELLEAS